MYNLPNKFVTDIIHEVKNMSTVINIFGALHPNKLLFLKVL